MMEQVVGSSCAYGYIQEFWAWEDNTFHTYSFGMGNDELIAYRDGVQFQNYSANSVNCPASLGNAARINSFIGGSICSVENPSDEAYNMHVKMEMEWLAIHDKVLNTAEAQVTDIPRRLCHHVLLDGRCICCLIACTRKLIQ